MSSQVIPPSVLIVSLSQLQASAIASLLPVGYSFQSAGSKVNKNVQMRKINNNMLQSQSNVQNQQVQSKRRKPRGYDQNQQERSRSVLTVKQELARRWAIVKKLKKHEDSWPFRSPVDPKLLLIPNYNQIVLVPMDLQAIQQRLKSQKYDHHAQVDRDILQMFLNSYKFNAKDNQYFEATSKLEVYFHALVNQQEGGERKSDEKDQRKGQKDKDREKDKDNKDKKKKDENINNGNHYETDKSNQINQFQKDIAILLKKATQITPQSSVRQKPIYISSKHESAMNIKQKRQLSQQLKSLDESHFTRIFQIVRQMGKEGATDLKYDSKNDIYSIDLQKLDGKILRELQNYVRLQKNYGSGGTVPLQESEYSHENQYGVC